MRQGMANLSSAGPVRMISGLREISPDYDAIFCDIWGVIHDGIQVFRAASDALVAYRRSGGTVILITNAPRPSGQISLQLQNLGASPEAFDDIATSGDVTVELMIERISEPVLHIGPDRDLTLFEAASKKGGRTLRRVPAEQAAYVLCTGLRDDTREIPENYDSEIKGLVQRDIPMICANPDLTIHRGDTLIYCAGALAQRYLAAGGKVSYAGKPHVPIYARALKLAEQARGSFLEPKKVLAIGDGMNTDIAGAATAGFDALLVTQGIHRDALHPGESTQADGPKLSRLCEAYGLWPTAATTCLRE